MDNIMTSLGLKLNVSKGYNQIQRQVTTYSPLYLTAGSIKDQAFTLVANGVYEEIGEITNLVLVVNNPVTLEFDVDDQGETVTTIVEIRKLVVFDFTILRFKLTAVVDTQVDINSVTTLDESPPA